MSRIEIAPEVADDLERILDHLLQFEIVDARARLGDIFTAIDVLACCGRMKIDQFMRVVPNEN